MNSRLVYIGVYHARNIEEAIFLAFKLYSEIIKKSFDGFEPKQFADIISKTNTGIILVDLADEIIDDKDYYVYYPSKNDIKIAYLGTYDMYCVPDNIKKLKRI